LEWAAGGKLVEERRHTCDSFQINLGSFVFNMWFLEMLKRWSKWIVPSPLFHKCSCPPWKKKE